MNQTRLFANKPHNASAGAEPAGIVRYSGYVATGNQSITITEVRQPRRTRKLWLLLLLLMPIVWHIGRRERDFHASYSGVVVEKGMDYSLIFRGRTPDLYVILRDDSGKRSKRYVCSSTCSTAELKRWSNLTEGTFVVKDPGFGEFPYQPGQKPTAQLASKSAGGGWLFVGLILVCATAILITLRQFWQAL